jgi:hypothetical protein
MPLNVEANISSHTSIGAPDCCFWPEAVFEFAGAWVLRVDWYNLCAELKASRNRKTRKKRRARFRRWRMAKRMMLVASGSGGFSLVRVRRWMRRLKATL